MDSEGKTAQQIIAEAIALRQALLEGRLQEVSHSLLTEDIEFSTEEVVQSDDKNENEIDEYSSNNQSIVEIDNLETEVDYSLYSDDIILNPTTTQETVEFLSNELFVVVENIKDFGRKQLKEVERLIAQIINFCNSLAIEEQWNTLAEITRRNSKTLAIVIGYSGKEHKDWFLNLPQLLANVAVYNSEELEWVNKR